MITQMPTQTDEREDLESSAPTADEVDGRSEEIREILEKAGGSIRARDLFGDHKACVTRAAIWQLTATGVAVLRPTIVTDEIGETAAALTLIKR